MSLRLAVVCVLVTTGIVVAAERPVDPTFLYRRLQQAQPKPSDVTTATCRYRPVFGEGDSETSIVKGVARFGEMIVEPGGESHRVAYPTEEQVYFVLSGTGLAHYGDSEHPLQKNDFLYLPPTISHGVSNPGAEPLRVLLMGWRIPEGTELRIPERLLIANTKMAKKQVVGNHPPSTLYQLLLGDYHSTRDVIAAGHVVTSLFLMDIKPGGTNHPHHHSKEEEIYLLLEGKGEMVAGGGIDGVEGRHPATAGDAYFLRLNATVGFYADPNPQSGNALVLAVRSLYPGMTR